MLNSISYLEIRCRYNESDLKQFTGALQDRDARRVVIYRNRRYFLSYDADDDTFYLVNKNCLRVAAISKMVFKFHVSNAPEIGLNLIWGLLAQLNIYPLTSL